jgi:hypothetical protein
MDRRLNLMGLIFPTWIDPNPGFFGRLGRIAYWVGALFAAMWLAVGAWLLVTGHGADAVFTLIFAMPGFAAGRAARYQFAAE